MGSNVLRLSVDVTAGGPRTDMGLRKVASAFAGSSQRTGSSRNRENVAAAVAGIAMLGAEQPPRLFDLVMALANRYCARMSFARIRRITALLMAISLAAGLFVHGVGGSDFGVQSAMAAATDMPMPGKCNGCAGDEKGLAPAACSAYCCAMIALPALSVILYAVPGERLHPTAGPHAISRIDPPEPYPPRPISMS